MLAAGMDTSIEAFLLASYYKYLVQARTESGEAIDIVEPHLGPADAALLQNCTPEGFLSLSCFAPLHLVKYPAFVEKYLSFVSLDVAQGLKML